MSQPERGLRRRQGHHWDVLVTGVMTLFCACFGRFLKQVIQHNCNYCRPSMDVRPANSMFRPRGSNGHNETKWTNCRKCGRAAGDNYCSVVDYLYVLFLK
jgi:hypothetical protein